MTPLDRSAETARGANEPEAPLRMAPLRIVVVGGVAAGASAAVKARRSNEDARITVFERGPYVSFANCGLPYYVGGDIENLGDLLLVTPQLFKARFKIDVELFHEVTKINRVEKTVVVLDHQSGQTRVEPYDRLIIATGGRPIMPPIPGIERPGVYSLTTVPDAKAIRDFATSGKVGRAVVVGAGFIGLEAVEALVNQGLEVHLVEKLPQVLPQMDAEMAKPLETYLIAQGAKLHLGSEVVRFGSYSEGGGEALSWVELGDGTKIQSSLAIVAIGVRPELTLPREAGLAIGAMGGVVVDDGMRTDDPSIYACGDIVETTSRITGKPVRLPLAGPANKQGRVAGANAVGGQMTFPGVVGTSIVKVCELSAGKTGLSEREARMAGFDPIVSYTHNASNATYYPGSEKMAIKLVVDRASGKVLGAQIVGGKGVDKRTDVIATAIYAGLTVEDLEGLDLAYAPPYSSAKDPTIMAGFVAANIYRGEVEATTVIKVARKLAAGEEIRLIDVRTLDEFEAGHIPTARHLPLEELRGKIDTIEPDWPVTVYCGVGYRSYHATKILQHHGIRAINLSGGFSSWALSYPENIQKPMVAGAVGDGREGVAGPS